MARPRKPGDRFPSGKLKGEPIAPALWDRVRKEALKAGGDPRLATELGRLQMNRELTASQVTTGFKIAEIYGRYERLEGKRRSTRSPSYEMGFGGGGEDEDAYLTAEQRNDKIDREQNTIAAYRALHDDMIPAYPRYLRGLLEELCVEDRAISPVYLDEIRRVLDKLALMFGKTTRGQHTQRPMKRPVVAKPSERRVDLERASFITVLRKLRPDLDDDQLTEAFELQRALKDRAVVRRAKERKQGNVYHLVK